MNVFEEISRTIMLQPDTSDELEILAKDAASLSKNERELLRRAAETLRGCYRYLALVQSDLNEANAHRMAASEQLAEMRRKLETIEKERKVKPVVPEASAPGPITWINLLAGPLVVNGPVYGKPFGS